MIKLVLFVLCSLAQMAVIAQKKADPAAYAKTITADNLKKHLTVIASAEMEGRDTPSPGLEKAADYIAAQFQKTGLQPGNNGSYRQSFQLSKDSVEGLSLTINGTSFEPYTDFAPGLSEASNIDLSFEEYAFVGYGLVDSTRDDYRGTDVTGKLVVLVNGAPPGFTSSKTGRLSPAFLFNKITTAQQKGAKAVLVVAESIPARFKTTVAYRPKFQSEAEGTPFPVFLISNKVVQSVSGRSLQEVTTSLNNGEAPLGINNASIRINYRLNSATASAANVIGVVPGSDKKDEYLFITAHYDHVGKDAQGNIYYGADDDGSGTVSVIQMAEAFAKAKKAGHGPRRTVVFMTVSGEEKGLWGSEYYSEHPIFPLERTTADLNIDMIGRIAIPYQNSPDSANYVYVIGDDKLSTDLAPITKTVNDRYLKMKLDPRFNDPNDPERIYYRSDHYNFARKGVPIIFYFDGMMEPGTDYHQPTDTIDKINFNLMSRRAQLVFYTAWEMANRDAMLKRDKALPE